LNGPDGPAQTRLEKHPPGPQTLRHWQNTLVTGEAAAAAWLMTFPLAGAAIIDDGAATNPTPIAKRAIKAIFLIVVSSIKGFGRLTRGLAFR
jgi:hypothetical protein